MNEQAPAEPITQPDLLAQFITAEPEMIWKVMKMQMPDVVKDIDEMLIKGCTTAQVMQFANGSGLPEPVITGTRRAVEWRRIQMFGAARNAG
jgi:hypothetical protein